MGEWVSADFSSMWIHKQNRDFSIIRRNQSESVTLMSVSQKVVMRI